MQHYTQHAQDNLPVALQVQFTVHTSAHGTGQDIMSFQVNVVKSKLINLTLTSTVFKVFNLVQNHTIPE